VGGGRDNRIEYLIRPKGYLVNMYGNSYAVNIQVFKSAWERKKENRQKSICRAFRK